MPNYYTDKADFKVYTVDEIMPYIKNANGNRMKILIALAFLTGARISEMLALRKKDFLVINDELRIVMKTLKRKGDYKRELIFSINDDPFIKGIMKFVDGLRKAETVLFPMTKRTYQARLLKLNRLIHGENTRKYIIFHQLRHSAITYLARDLRASAWEIASWTGHKSTAYEEYMIHGAAKRFKGKMRR